MASWMTIFRHRVTIETFSQAFGVTVDPVNDAPLLDVIGDVTINEDASQQTINLSGINAGGGETQSLRATAEY